MKLLSILTKDCNRKCKHCHVSAEPGNKKYTMSPKNFKEAIQNIDTLDLVTFKLSGGEIFTMPEKLYEYLEIINESGKEEMILINTNGLWLYKKDAKEIAKKLKDYGITYIEISSRDSIFHLEQKCKIPWKLVDEIIPQEIRHNIPGFDEEDFYGIPDLDVMPVGRGERFDDGYYDCEGDCMYKLNNNDFTMDWNGNLALCCFGFFRMGNLIEEPLSEIIKRNKNKRLIEVYEYKEIEDIARFYGVDNTITRRIIKEHGTGGLCAYLNREGFIPEEYKRIFD